MKLPDTAYFDLKGANAYCSLSGSALRNHINSGELPCFKVKGKILIKRSELDAWIEAYRHNRKQNINTIVNEALTSIKEKV